MRVVAIIQARMGSSRLPAKVLQDIGGRSMLERVVLRTREAETVDEVVVATTTSADDDQITAACKDLLAPATRGSTDDVLDRYHEAAQKFDADVIVRITSDCPLIDPSLIDDVVRAFRDATPDYASNFLVRTYPRGLDTEVVSRDALEKAWRRSSGPKYRAHVTSYVYLHPDEFSLVSVTGPTDQSEFRWTVDTDLDLEVVRDIYAAGANELMLSWQDALAIVRADPERLARNRTVRQKALEEG